MKAELIVLDGSARRFPLTDGSELTVGSSARSTVRIGALDVSRTHAMITCQRGKVSLLDLGSTNGTFVNGRRVKEAELAAGDVVRFSSVIAQVMPVGNGSSGSVEVVRELDGEQRTLPLRDPELTSGEVPVLLQDSLLWLLRRWDNVADGALVVLVEWLVGQRGMTGAAVAEECDGEIMVRAAHGNLADVLDDPRLGSVVRSAAHQGDPLESVHLRLGTHEVMAVHGAGLPSLLVLPGLSMPSSSEIELFAALLRIAQRLDAAPVAPRRSGGRARSR